MNYKLFILDDMFDKNTILINDINGIMNKMNDHNITTVNIFSNMKEKVIFIIVNLKKCLNKSFFFKGS